MKNLLIFSFLILGFILRGQVESVGIGTSSPNPSSILELLSNDKGIMIPKISLNDLNLRDYSFMSTTPTISLLVYNTNEKVKGGKGLYYWDGSKWVFYFGSANINLLLGITKYKSKIYNNGVSTNTYNSESSSVSAFTNGNSLTSPWVEVQDGTPLNFVIDRPTNNVVITFTGMLQLNNTSVSDINLNYGLGIFIDNKLVASKSAALVSENLCYFKEFTITGFADNLSAGTHTITLAVMNRSSNNTISVNYGQKAPSCSTITSDEAKISAIVLINQPLDL